MTAAGDASHGELLDALRVIQEALEIPYAATLGDQVIRDKIIKERLLHVTTMLDGLLGRRLDLLGGPPPEVTGRPLPASPTPVAWQTNYLREKLAEHPATGYRLYSELRADPKAFYASLLAEREVIGSDHVDG